MFLGILKNVKTPPVPSVPADFFQSPTPPPVTNVKQEPEEKVEEQESEIVEDLNLDKGELPKGFFDDPMLDAKVSYCLI